MTLVRLALGLVFVWFGALKLAGDSQIGFLATATIGFVPEALLTLGLGVFEVAIGLGLVLGIALRLTLFLFWTHLGGTFLVFVLRPEIAFLGDNPFCPHRVGRVRGEEPRVCRGGPCRRVHGATSRTTIAPRLLESAIASPMGTWRL